MSFLEKNPNSLNKPTNEDSNKILYVEKFEINDLEAKSKQALEQLTNLKERNINSFREDKQREEEKNIDLTTKKKIYTSRLNIANSEVFSISSN